MLSSFWVMAALGACALSAPTAPPAPMDMSVLSAYFQLLASKVEAAKQMSSTPVCDLDLAVMPAGKSRPVPTLCSSQSAKLSSAPTPLPPPSTGLTLKHVAVGRGTQNYSCADSTSATVPVALGAVATLFNATCLSAVSPAILSALPSLALQYNLTSATQAALAPPASDVLISGHHYFSNPTTPTFNMDTTASMQLGFAPCMKNNTEAAPASAPKGQQGEKAVAWLKLITKDATGGLEEVYRVNTAGGSAPATCAGMASTFEVQYSAEYWFWQST